MPVLDDRSDARRGIAKRSRGVRRTAGRLKYAWLEGVAYMETIRATPNLRERDAMYRWGIAMVCSELPRKAGKTTYPLAMRTLNGARRPNDNNETWVLLSEFRISSARTRSKIIASHALGALIEVDLLDTCQPQYIDCNFEIFFLAN